MRALRGRSLRDEGGAGSPGLAAARRWVEPLTPAQRRALAAILVGGALLRVLWVAWAAREHVGLHDPLLYVLYGEVFADGGGYHLPSLPGLDTGATAYYPVGYPASLGFVFWVFDLLPLEWSRAKVVGSYHAVLGVATIFLVFAIARRLFGNRVALVAAALVAVYPNLVYHSGVALSETLFIFSTLLAILVLVWKPWGEGFTRGHLLLFGVLVGLSALVRPVSFMLVPAAVVAWAAMRAGWRTVLSRVGWIAVAAAVVIAPWTIRNIRAMDSFVLISTNLGDDLCVGANPRAYGGFAPDCFALHEDLPRPEGEVRANNENTRDALEYWARNPLRMVRLTAWKAYYLFESDHDGMEAVESYGEDRWVERQPALLLRTLADAWYFGLLALGLVGLRQLRLRDDRRRLFLVVTMALLALLPLGFFGDPRFKVPATPLLCICAAVTVTALQSDRRHRRSTGATPVDRAPARPDDELVTVQAGDEQREDLR